MAAKIVFFGTSEFAVPALEALVKEGYNVVGVVTTPDEPAGRKQIPAPPPVKISGEKMGLKIIQPEKLRDNFEFIEELRQLKPDIGIVASYGKIIPPEVLKLPKDGLLNIHPSLLPRYRGPTPIQSALLNGDTETGITILEVDEQVDHGPIIAQSEKRKIKNEEKYEELEKNLAEVGARLLIKILPDYLSGKIKPEEQDHSKATFTKLLKKSDGEIDWSKSAQEIYNQFRALHRWPGIWTAWRGETLKITDCKVSDGKLEILRLQPAGGREMSLKEFLAGHPDFTLPPTP